MRFDSITQNKIFAVEGLEGKKFNEEFEYLNCIIP